MKTVTYEEFIKFEPYWSGDEEQANRLKAYFEATPNMSALDMLGLNDVSVEDRFWAALREELIPANTLHEFACLCAERALSTEGNPDPRSLEAIVAKRKWLNGEITDVELETARSAAWGATLKAAWGATLKAAWGATLKAARGVTSAAARSAAWDEERVWQVETLIKLLEKEDNQ